MSILGVGVRTRLAEQYLTLNYVDNVHRTLRYERWLQGETTSTDG